MNKNIGFLHPGAMGSSLAASVVKSGNTAYWASEDRSTHTRDRAERHGLIDAGTVVELCQQCSILVSICPPHAAIDVANEVIQSGFTGIYTDANAISPQNAEMIGKAMEAVSIDFVDGSIIGPPAWQPGKTWLYLSGSQADSVASCFSKGSVIIENLGDTVGKASALKMCFAANSKGTTALWIAILATAESLGVRSALQDIWQHKSPHLAEDAEDRLIQAMSKAWRFKGEMEEIAATFNAAGLPSGFHIAASDIYARLAAVEKEEVSPQADTLLTAISQPLNE